MAQRASIMSEAGLEQSSAEVARAIFTREALPFPPLPPAMTPALIQCSDNVFATRKLEQTPYLLEHFRGEVRREVVADYAIVGFDGHGVNSWAVHYYLVDDALALFIQLAWGGVYTDAAEARELIAEAFEWAARLQERVREASKRGLIPRDWRLLVVASEFAEPGWAWLPPPQPEPEPLDYVVQRPDNLMPKVDAALDELFADGKPLNAP
jgi:hypothetical protein